MCTKCDGVVGIYLPDLGKQMRHDRNSSLITEVQLYCRSSVVNSPLSQPERDTYNHKYSPIYKSKFTRVNWSIFI